MRGEAGTLRGEGSSSSATLTALSSPPGNPGPICQTMGPWQETDLPSTFTSLGHHLPPQPSPGALPIWMDSPPQTIPAPHSFHLKGTQWLHGFLVTAPEPPGTKQGLSQTMAGVPGKGKSRKSPRSQGSRGRPRQSTCRKNPGPLTLHSCRPTLLFHGFPRLPAPSISGAPWSMPFHVDPQPWTARVGGLPPAHGTGVFLRQNRTDRVPP